MPRIELLNDKSLLPEEQHAEFDAIVEVLHRVGGPFAILLRSPGLAQKVMAAGAQVRLGSILESKQRELTILAVAREKDGAYEWASHVETARKGGLGEETIEAVRHAADVSGLPDDDRDIVEYVRQLLRTNKVEQPLFDALRERKGERWLVELTATIGQYQYITAINNAFDLQPAPDADQLPV
ncbi:MAG TPA: carboxymuconolactone decarboxylase family protein [Acidimicrobiales bacterium]|nr:carboxymuconolactone decarboxylase family protein [Acidimicrobiales bacterium]